MLAVLIPVPKQPEVVKKPVVEPPPVVEGKPEWKSRAELVQFFCPSLRKALEMLQTSVNSLPPSEDPNANVTLDRIADMLALARDSIEDVQEFVELEKAVMTRPPTEAGERVTATPGKDISRVEFSLHTSLHRAITAAKDMAAENVVMKQEIAGDIPCGTVWGNVSVVNQALFHLLFNAVKFTPPGGQISLKVEFVERIGIEQLRLRFVVSDSGPGIHPDLLEGGPNNNNGESSFRRAGGAAKPVGLFVPFSDVRKDVARAFNREGQTLGAKLPNNSEMIALARAEGLERAGAGLGLPTVYLLAREINGDVAIESRCENDGRPEDAHGGLMSTTGTTVSFTGVFDIGQTLRQAMVSIGTPPATPGLRKRGLQRKSVLVVDDEKVNRRVAGRLLSNAHYEVDVAVNGREAVTKCFPPGGKPANYSVILMDVNMPEMNGMRATELLRSKGCKTSVLALTSDNSKANQMKCMWSGMDGFIGKPFRKDNVTSMVSKWSSMQHSTATKFTAVEGSDEAAAIAFSSGADLSPLPDRKKPSDFSAPSELDGLEEKGDKRPKRGAGEGDSAPGTGGVLAPIPPAKLPSRRESNSGLSKVEE